MALINGVQALSEYDGIMLYTMNEYTGHSLIVVAYFWATGRHMCIWYHKTLFLLAMSHVSNLMYYYGLVYYNPIEMIVLLCMLSILLFISYRTSVGITKLLRL